jgi:hypothetical protein
MDAKGQQTGRRRGGFKRAVHEVKTCAFWLPPPP